MPIHTRSVADRRVEKTKKLLRAALISLIAEKPYDSIVVKEILDRANVGRSTFYMHFRDKDDLLVSGIYQMVGPPPPTPGRSPTNRHDRLLWFSLRVFEHHHRHAHEWNDRIGAEGRAILHEHLRREIAKVVAGEANRELRSVRKPSARIPTDLLSKYIASTFVLVLNWWLEKKMYLPPKEINDVFRELVVPTLTLV